MEIPESKYEFHHRLPVQMRFTDIDVFGHVNNNVYLQYFDLGKLGYINASLGSLFDPKEKALVVANLNCDFCHPTVYGDEIEVVTRTDSIGAHSITLEQSVMSRATRQVKCVCRTVMVGFDVKAGSVIEIPAGWHARISAFEGREIQVTGNP